jgi:hypothetical protein
MNGARRTMGRVLIGLAILAPGPLLAQTMQPLGVLARPQVTARQPWCDFGAHARQFAALAPAADPVFRQPSESDKARFGQVRKAVMLGTLDRSAALPQLRALFAEFDGPALARLGVQDADAKVAALVLEAARAVVAVHPRIFALAADRFHHPDPAVALAAVHMAFATGCDAPALYALDGLHHPDVTVQLATLAEVAQASRTRLDIGLADKVAAWLDAGQGLAEARLSGLRMLGELGWLPATATLDRLTRGVKTTEAAEAFAALAVVAPTEVTPRLEAWLHDKAPVKRAAAARAVAQVLAMEPARVQRLLQPLLNDRALGADALAPRSTVAEVASRALARVRMEP